MSASTAESSAADRSAVGGPAPVERGVVAELLGVDERPAPRWWPVMAVAVAAPLLMAPVFWRMILYPAVRMMDTNDFLFHIRIATDETSIIPLDIPAPHPLFHLSVVVLEPVLGPSRGALATMMVAVALTVAALVLIARAPTPTSSRLSPTWAAAFAAVWVVAESPTVLYQWATGADAPYAIVHFWGSPTEVVFVPFALVLALILGDIIQRPERYVHRRGPTALVWALVVVTALAKPSLGLVFAPAAVGLVVLFPRWRSSWRAVLRLFVLPAALVAVGQALFLVVGPVPTGRSGFAFAPMDVLGEVIRAGGPAFWLMPVAMVALVPAVRGRLASDPCFVVSGLGLVVAFPPMILLMETGPRAEDAALLKLGFAALTILLVFLLRAAVVEVRDRLRDRRDGAGLSWRVPWIATILATLVASGIVTYAETMALPGGQLG